MEETGLKKVYKDVTLLQIWTVGALVATGILVATEVQNLANLQETGIDAIQINLKKNVLLEFLITLIKIFART